MVTPHEVDDESDDVCDEQHGTAYATGDDGRLCFATVMLGIATDWRRRPCGERCSPVERG